MAGTLTIDTLKASSGVLATQNGMTGIAKAWVNFNGSAVTITGSFNVSSISRTSTGVFVVNFTTAMPSATYAVTTAAKIANDTYDTGPYIEAQTTSSMTLNCSGGPPSYMYNPTIVCATVFA